MSTQTNIKQAVPFLMVTAMDVSLKFYVDGLGFKVINQWQPRGNIEWCWLQRDSGALMLQEHRVPKAGPGNAGIDVAICFQCLDALALYDEFLAKGLKPAERFVGNNLWVVAIRDPDNFDISFQSPTDVPEETTYTEWRKGIHS